MEHSVVDDVDIMGWDDGERCSTAKAQALRLMGAVNERLDHEIHGEDDLA
jgi:hypothetical protein